MFFHSFFEGVEPFFHFAVGLGVVSAGSPELDVECSEFLFELGNRSLACFVSFVGVELGSLVTEYDDWRNAVHKGCLVEDVHSVFFCGVREFCCGHDFSAFIVDKSTNLSALVVGPVAVPHVVADGPFVAYVAALSTSFHAGFSQSCGVQNFLDLSLRNVKAFFFDREMQFLTAIIRFFSKSNDFLSKEGIDSRRRPSGLLRQVCRGALSFMLSNKLMDHTSTNLLYPSYGGSASAPSILLYNPTSFFSLSFTIKITQNMEFLAHF